MGLFILGLVIGGFVGFGTLALVVGGKQKMSKEELMKELLDLYQQRKFVTLKSTKLIVDNYIRKLELKLIGELKYEKCDF